MRETVAFYSIKTWISIVVITIILDLSFVSACAKNVIVAEYPAEVGVGRSFSVDYVFTTDVDIGAVHMKFSFDNNISFKKIETSVGCYKKIYKKTDGIEMIIIPDDYFITDDYFTVTFTALSGRPSGEHTISLDIMEAIDTNKNDIDLSADTFIIKAVRAGDSSSEKKTSSSSKNVHSSSKTVVSETASTRSKTVTSSKTSGKASSKSSSRSSSSAASSSSRTTSRSTRSERSTRSNSRRNSENDDEYYDEENDNNYDDYEDNENENENDNDNRRVEYYSKNSSNDSSVKLKYIFVGVLSTLTVVGVLYYVFMLGRRTAEDEIKKKKDDFD